MKNVICLLDAIWYSLRERGYYILARKIPAPIKIKSALPPPPPKKPKIPLPKTRNFKAWRFSCRKNAIFPGAHKIGAANSGPRIAGKKFYGHEDFLNFGHFLGAPRETRQIKP